jgi:hypothetical protein
MKVRVNIVDDRTITALEIYEFSTKPPQMLKAGQRHNESLMEYAELRFLAESNPGTTDFTIRPLTEVEIVDTPVDQIRVGRGSTWWQLYRGQTDGILGLSGRYSHDDLIQKGPGRHFLERSSG